MLARISNQIKQTSERSERGLWVRPMRKDHGIILTGSQSPAQCAGLFYLGARHACMSTFKVVGEKHQPRRKQSAGLFSLVALCAFTSTFNVVGEKH